MRRTSYPGIEDHMDPLMESYVPSDMNPKAFILGTDKALKVSRFVPEATVVEITKYLAELYAPGWASPTELSYEESLTNLDLSKSPGYPYFENCSNKLQALERMGDLVRSNVDDLFNDVEVPCIFNLSLKDELREREKVVQGKTRVFSASPMHHQIACDMLLRYQNQWMMDNIGKHPVAVGIQLPGPGFSTLMASVETGTSGDVSGQDQSFILRVARAIRDLRKILLPRKRHRLLDYLYSCVFAAIVMCNGAFYRFFCMQSGSYITSTDNSLCLVFYICIAIDHLLGVGAFREEIRKLFTNGDDHVVNLRNLLYVSVTKVLRERYGINVTIGHETPLDYKQLVFLSHSLVPRFSDDLGRYVLVAAGNLPKLLSSLLWAKAKATMTWDEVQYAHLLGLRMCLFAWPEWWNMADDLTSRFLVGRVMTQFMIDITPARMSEWQMFCLHTRYEAAVFSPQIVGAVQKINGCLNQVDLGPFKVSRTFTSDIHTCVIQINDFFCSRQKEQNQPKRLTQ